MKILQRKVLEQLIGGCAEPILVARIDRPDWPVVLCNPAFHGIGGHEKTLGLPFADVVELLVGRDVALEVSESVRQIQETTLPVEIRGREYLLALKPLNFQDDPTTRHFAAYWRGAANSTSTPGDQEAQQALLKARRHIRDISRDDPVTGLLNSKAFREVLDHDWAVASREQSRLALVAFELLDFDQYVAVFGRHAADSCLRRVAQTIRRCLRRASDVAARVDGPAGDRLVVLSHASEKEGVTEFATRIATAVRELGLHHPRSNNEKYLTVSFRVDVQQAKAGALTAADFLNGVLGS